MRSTIAALGCLVAGTLGLLALPASVARADSSVPLTQLASLHQMLLDSPAGLIFFSEGLSSTALLNGSDTASAIVVYRQIGWFPNQTFGCLPLNRLSKVATTIGLARAGGARYRMRADYFHGKDAANLSTSGSWFYFEVVN